MLDTRNQSPKRVFKIRLQGEKITTIADFYAQINTLLMQNEDWKLGESLDAFNDLLYGGFSAWKDYDILEIEWKNIEIARKNLGLETTIQYYLNKLHSPNQYNKTWIENKLADLASGKGKTYFEIILDIIKEHDKNVKLITN